MYNQQALFYNNTEKTKYKLNDIPDFITEPKDIITENRNKRKANKASKYFGVYLSKQMSKTLPHYISQLIYNNKSLYLGTFLSELEAAKNYNQMAAYLNINKKKKYKLNDIPNYITEPKDIYTTLQHKNDIAIIM